MKRLIFGLILLLVSILLMGCEGQRTEVSVDQYSFALKCI